MIKRIRYYFLRKLYAYLYWMGQLDPYSKILIGYYKKYPTPTEVPNNMLHHWIERLGKDIQETGENESRL